MKKILRLCEGVEEISLLTSQDLVVESLSFEEDYVLVEALDISDTPKSHEYHLPEKLVFPAEPGYYFTKRCEEREGNTIIRDEVMVKVLDVKGGKYYPLSQPTLSYT